MRISGVPSPTPLLVEVLDEAARESCLLALPSRWKLLRPLNCQRTPPTIPARHATSLPVPHRCLCFYSCFCLGLAPGPYGLYADFVSLLAWAQSYRALSPAIQMFRTHFPHQRLEDPVDKPGTTMGTQCSVLHRMFLLFFTKMWLLTTDPLKGRNIRDLRRAFQAIELAAYPRGAAPFRINPNR